ncbi:MAG: hypothetical protein JWM16_961 [Verrucomicrobiales bacterium]|nr:hypothetical protein [Verrucomicrobiales bacterium]
MKRSRTSENRNVASDAFDKAIPTMNTVLPSLPQPSVIALILFAFLLSPEAEVLSAPLSESVGGAPTIQLQPALLLTDYSSVKFVAAGRGIGKIIRNLPAGKIGQCRPVDQIRGSFD